MGKKKETKKDIGLHIPYKKRVACIYIEQERGVVFTTTDNEEYGFKVYHDASGAVSSIELEAL